MRLRDSVPKRSGGGEHREVSAAATFERVRPHLRRAGITRIADITGLDRVGIPVFNAICPRSADTVSVYNGKGETPLAAKVSAVMEAFERFAATLPLRPTTVATGEQLRASGRPAVAVTDLNLPRQRGWHDGLPLSWVTGHDLVRDEPVLAPQHALAYGVGTFHEHPCYTFTTSNGLAAGNSPEEAICHALTEIVERDAATLADLLGRQLRAIAAGRLSDPARRAAVLDRIDAHYPTVDLATVPPRPAALASRLTDAGVALTVLDMTSDLGLPTFRAVTFEDLGPETSQGHQGMGCHPDAEVALVRALTEVAQSRAVDIQAMREDLAPLGAEVPATQLHVRRAAPRDRAGWTATGARVPFAAVRSYPSADVVTDIRLMLDRLVAVGLDRVVVVDISPPDIPVTVVRVLVPGAESWGIDRGMLGPRAVAAWNAAVTGLLTGDDRPRRTTMPVTAGSVTTMSVSAGSMAEPGAAAPGPSRPATVGGRP